MIYIKLFLIALMTAAIPILLYEGQKPAVLSQPIVTQVTPAPAPSPTPVPILPDTKVTDNRIDVLQAYLAKFDSPVKDHAKDFIEAADQYGVDWKLVPAISGVESTFCKKIPGGQSPKSTTYNCWGWGVYGNQALGFKSWRDGIFTVTEGLKTKYIDDGLTTPFTMNRRYAASKTWGGKVDFFMKEIEEFSQEFEIEAKAVE